MKTAPLLPENLAIDTMLDEAVQLCCETDDWLGHCVTTVLQRPIPLPSRPVIEHVNPSALTALRMLDYLSREGSEELGMRRDQIEMSIAIVKAWLTRPPAGH